MSQGQAFAYDAETRARLRELAVAVEREETPSPTETRAPLALWCDVAEGRSRLVEHFERDGRRYYVAYDSRAGMTPPLPLNPRERLLVMLVGSGQSEKAVGYALGVRSSAVSGLLKTTLVKLGMRSRTELVLFVGALGLKPGDEFSAWGTSSSRAAGPAPLAPEAPGVARRSAEPCSSPPSRDERTRGRPSGAPSQPMVASGPRVPRPG
jgi:DNA-binding CsgD family transcriptional regulator